MPSGLLQRVTHGRAVARRLAGAGPGSGGAHRLRRCCCLHRRRSSHVGGTRQSRRMSANPASRLPSLHELRATRVRASLTLGDTVGLALRAERRCSRESQREYALGRGWSAAHQARLETIAEELPLGRVLTALADTDHAIAVAGQVVAPHLVQLSVPADLCRWLRDELGASRRSGRWLAAASGLSQSMVSRLTDPRRAGGVQLARAAQAVGVLGGRVVLGGWTDEGLRELDPQAWPAAAVVPRVRGDGRRLAAHRWIRLGMPFWWRWREDLPVGPMPSWTAQSPAEPRHGQVEQQGNALAPLHPVTDRDDDERR